MTVALPNGTHVMFINVYGTTAPADSWQCFRAVLTYFYALCYCLPPYTCRSVCSSYIVLLGAP